MEADRNNNLQSGLMDPSQGGTLQRTLSERSLDSVLPPPLQHKRRVRFLLSILVPVTLATLVVCCVYSDLAGHAQYWYNKPESWQFCIVYADSTIQLWDKKVRGTYPGLHFAWAAQPTSTSEQSAGLRRRGDQPLVHGALEHYLHLGWPRCDFSGAIPLRVDSVDHCFPSLQLVRAAVLLPKHQPGYGAAEAAQHFAVRYGLGESNVQVFSPRH